MAKLLLSTLAIVLVTFMVTDAFRTKNRSTREPQVTQCIAEGIASGAVGMSITWGSAKAMKECGPTRHNQSAGMTYEWQFTNAFSVSFDSKCICKIEGKTIVSFKAITLQQAKICAGTEPEDDPMKIKSHCWEAYKRGRGTRFHVAGSMQVPEYKVPWLHGNFRVGREGKCSGEACNTIVLPGVIEDMTREHKRFIGDAIQKIMNGEKDKVPKILLEMIEILPPDALDDAEFQQIDEDGDGTLTLDELSDFYTEFDRSVMDKFIKEIDANGNGTVDPKEFGDLKQKMRDYDPNVDLIDGQNDFLLSPSGEVREPQPEWKAATVVCMKGAVAVSLEECEGSEADAIVEYNTNC